MTVLAVLLLVSETAGAYPAKDSETLDCNDGRAPVGNLGITGMKWKGSFTMHPDKDERWWLFQAEPKILSVDPDGPSAGILRPGDVIVAVNGLAITTRKGGMRFGNLTPREPVELTIRRGSRTLDKEITPVAVCLEDHPLHFAAPEPPDIVLHTEKLAELSRKLEALAEMDLPELPDFPDLTNLTRLSIRPKAWFGMGLSCDGCTIQTGKDDESAEWQFDNPPTVESVEPGGPADEAGIRDGDVLLEIDGIDIDSHKGGKRFSSVEPGETVTWTIRRGSKRETIEMHALEHPDRDVVFEHPTIVIHEDSFEDSPVRFNGVLGGTDIEVRGKKSVQVTRDESAGEIVIKTRDAVIRLRSKEKKD
jgi:hypothetical protein